MIKIYQKIIFSTFLGLMTCAVTAKPISFGIGLGVTDPAYKGYRVNAYPLVTASFDNGVFFIDNLSAGMFIYHDNVQEASFGVRYLPLSFKTQRTDNEQLKLLNNRKGSYLGEFKYTHRLNFGTISASAGFDLLNDSQTVLLNLNYSYQHRIGYVALIPSIGVNWVNGKHNQYYYGIDQHEAKVSGLPYYQPGSAYQPYLGVTAMVWLSPEWSFYGGARLDKLMGAAKNSPMISHSAIASAYIGIIYTY